MKLYPISNCIEAREDEGVREVIPHIGPISIVFPLKLFLEGIDFPTVEDKSTHPGKPKKLKTRILSDGTYPRGLCELLFIEKFKPHLCQQFEITKRCFSVCTSKKPQVENSLSKTNTRKVISTDVLIK